LLKLYLYGYLNQIRSSRRLETECRRNVELMWLLGRLYPDHKSIAEFRRLHRDAVTAAGAELVQFAKSCGLSRGEWVAIDGSKFRAVSSIDTARERFQLQRYLDSMEKADQEQQIALDPAAVEAALQKLKHHPEPEVGFMLMGRNTLPAYNMQSAVDSEHALIVAHEVALDAADNRCLLPMAEAARTALGVQTFHVVADAGYSNGEQAAACEAAGMLPHVPATRTVNPNGNGTFSKELTSAINLRQIHISARAIKILRRRALHRKDKRTEYEANTKDCGRCTLKSHCTSSVRRTISRHTYEEALDRMQGRVTPALMTLRKSVVEHPFATIKHRIFGHPRLLMRGLSGARVEIGIATMAYNIKRMTKVLGATRLTKALHAA